MIKINKLFKVVVLSLVVSLLSACTLVKNSGEMISDATDYFLGGADNTEPPAELVEYKPEIEIDVLWKESVGDGAGNQFLNLVLAVSYGKVLAADNNGLVHARDIKTGDLIWEAETDYSFSAGPGIGSNTVILASSNAEIVALDVETGEIKWVIPVSSEVLATPLIANNIVIIRTTDGKVFALSEENGEQLWVFERSVPALSIRGTGTPIIVEGNVIAGYANGKLLALRLTDGKVGWETSVAIPSGRSEVERLVDLDVNPVETDGVIFISSYQGGTTAVLELDGDVLWRKEEVSSYSGLQWRFTLEAG
jgi:outer membrane protein assembly factor BamB